MKKTDLLPDERKIPPVTIGYTPGYMGFRPKFRDPLKQYEDIKKQRLKNKDIIIDREKIDLQKLNVPIVGYRGFYKGKKS